MLAPTLNQPPWNHVDASGDCWVWTGARSNGYGSVRVGGKYGQSKGAHRHVYQLLVGPVPEGLTLDHLCRNRACVNPDHLEPVPMVVNSARGYSPYARKARQTHCSRGHLFTPETTGINTKPGHGRRRCIPCDRARHARERTMRALATGRY